VAVFFQKVLGPWPALLLGLVLLFLSAEGLHRVVEAPARRWGRAWARRHTAQKTSVSPG
jgi:peptidoglycan/LPS O-acetylase OafA/YrhL